MTQEGKKPRCLKKFMRPGGVREALSIGGGSMNDSHNTAEINFMRKTRQSGFKTQGPKDKTGGPEWENTPSKFCGSLYAPKNSSKKDTPVKKTKTGTIGQRQFSFNLRRRKEGQPEGNPNGIYSCNCRNLPSRDGAALLLNTGKDGRYRIEHINAQYVLTA